MTRTAAAAVMTTATVTRTMMTSLVDQRRRSHNVRPAADLNQPGLLRPALHVTQRMLKAAAQRMERTAAQRMERTAAQRMERAAVVGPALSGSLTSLPGTEMTALPVRISTKT